MHLMTILTVFACLVTPYTRKTDITVQSEEPSYEDTTNEPSNTQDSSDSTDTEDIIDTEDTVEPEDTADTNNTTPIDTGSSYPNAETCFDSNPVNDDLLPSMGTMQTETTNVDGFTDDYLYDSNGYLKVGVRRDWGGTIIFYGLTNNSGPGVNNSNTIDANDTGREVQVAFYDPDRVMQGCAHNASCASTPTTCPNSISYLGWNPVQGGNRCNNGSPVSNYSFQLDRMVHAIMPLHWNPNWDFPNCTNDGCNDPALANRSADIVITQSLRFVRQHVLELRYTLTETAGINHGVTLQELPTVYAANGINGPDLWKLLDANGTQIDINQPANDGFFVRSFTSTEPWVTLQNDNLNYGVGLLHENSLLDFQGWQNRGLPFNNFRSSFYFGIPAYGNVNARAYLLIGGYSTIQADATWLQNNLPPFGALDSPLDASIHQGDSLTLRGWGLDNRGITSIYALIDDTLHVPLSLGSSRADVNAAWPGYANGGNSGFDTTIDVSTLHHDPTCGHRIEIVSEDTDGNSRVIARNHFFLTP